MKYLDPKYSNKYKTKASLKQLKVGELRNIYKSQLVKEEQEKQEVKAYGEQVYLKNLKRLDRHSENLVLRQLYMKQRNHLILELGRYAQSVYKLRSNHDWWSRCNLQKPRVKEAYNALPSKTKQNMKDHYSEVISILFDSQSIAFCGMFMNIKYIERLLDELYIVKSKLTSLRI